MITWKWFLEICVDQMRNLAHKQFVLDGWKSFAKAMATLGMDSRSAAGELKYFGRFRKRVFRYRVCMYQQDKSLVDGHYIFSVHTREPAGRSSAEAAKDV